VDVFAKPRTPAQGYGIDLETVRATVSYMHDDAAGTPGMERLAAAFARVLSEIDAAARQQPAARPDPTPMSARFIAFRRPATGRVG
jgi:hypothetical protein